MGNKRKWRSLLLVGLVLILASLVVACEGQRQPASAPTSTPTVTVTAPTPTPEPAPMPTQTPPRGSVLELKGGYLAGEGAGDYWGFQITTKVQNLGDAGILTVFAEITPQDYVDKGKNWQITEVYLRQGEDKQLNFHFWVKWPNEGFEYSVKTRPSN